MTVKKTKSSELAQLRNLTIEVVPLFDSDGEYMHRYGWRVLDKMTGATLLSSGSLILMSPEQALDDLGKIANVLSQYNVMIGERHAADV